jgi:HEAT repeat protein
MQEIQEILNKLKDNNWWVRKNTIENLLAYPEDSYLSVLEEWLRNGDDALLRNAAMEAFRTLGGKAVRSLISLLKDEDSDVRVFAANILGDIKQGDSLNALIDSLNDSDINVRVASAEALGKIGDEMAVSSLANRLDDASWAAMACIEALGEIGGDKALSVLHKCLEKEEYHGITFAAIENAGDMHCIRRLTPYVDREGEMRELALKAIVNIADREGTRPLPSYFISLVPLLMELQQSPMHELKKAAFIALSWSEDIRGLQYFIDAINSDDLQEYAIKGLMSLGKKAVPGIIDSFKKTSGNRAILAKVLSMLGENHALLKFADDDDPEVRTEVALAIGALKTSKAKDILLILEQDEAEEVREAARLSLKNFGNTAINSL